VRGQDEATATKTLQDAGFSNISTTEVDSTEPEGSVIGTDPAPGSQTAAGTRITLQLSGGVGTIVVPDVSGQPEAAARLALQNAGFTNVVRQDTEGNGEVPGTVVGTNPPANSQVRPDDEITLLVVPLPAG
jgi:serine/threonine-protein kinase